MVAVSGGVDSVALLDMLAGQKNLELIIAHFDHGIREDSAEDALFVKGLAAKYGLVFVDGRGELGAEASEETGRLARYGFLENVKKDHGATAIVTAHHQDDLIETAVINTLRGTKRRGLVSLRSTEQVKRPLLGMTKKQIVAYAKVKKLTWREDSTNKSDDYLRNRVRKLIKSSLNSKKRLVVIESLEKVKNCDDQVNELVNEILIKCSGGNNLDKKFINSLYLAEAYEITAGWLRGNGAGFDSRALSRLVISARILNTGAEADLTGGWFCRIGRQQITLRRR